MSGKAPKKGFLQTIGILSSDDQGQANDAAKGPTPPPAPPSVPSVTPIIGAISGSVDSGMLERMRSDVDKAATPAFHAFRDKLKSLESVQGMSDQQRVAAAIATCGFPKDQILQGVRSRAAELDRLVESFNRDVEQARTTQLGAKDETIKQVDERIADRRRQADDQIGMLKKQIEQITAAAETDITNLTTQKTTAQTERATLDQQLNTSIATFTSTAAQLRSEVTTQTATFTAALNG